ncbi:App1 family protein [Xanthocytophaga agilis]|uniref:DUF2183 domain-containing protein n=1 Tax=Xanthocytophaga agilis TaxID=3048010 RepID=A0AAE3UFZ6_9BACT|nr:phosphatase domain-containing protein [Xanthocytophaga agilis]MDJ1501872.1 DUF2183 domain-containing protein [Xanthocytophaga agilis]
MSSVKNAFFNLLGAIEEGFDAVRNRFRKPLQKIKGIRIVPYTGFSNGTSLFLKGRVIRNPFTFTPRDRASRWHNLRDTYRRFSTHEMAGVQVELRWNESLHIATTDEEGYFTFQLEDLPQSNSSVMIWGKLDLRLVTQTADEPAITAADILIPPTSAQFGVISDIDDTVLVSNATHKLRMAKLAFFYNARTRLPFEGVASFYQALQKGTSAGVFNPIFYVSSSPWNLFDMLTEFFNWQKIPQGPLMLKDIGISRTQVGGASHHTHKLAQIKLIMSMYPNLPFILIGDSGQHDPEIYRQVVLDYPGRILAIYIRDVSKDKRDLEVETIISSIANSSVPMFLIPDTEAAAQHAAANGWIAREEISEVKEEISETKKDVSSSILQSDNMTEEKG